MPSPIEMALSSLLPTVSYLPPELTSLATSLLAQSRTKASSLKPEEEIGRSYACCHLACQRLGHKLALEIAKPQPPVKPKVYEKLHTYLNAVLKSRTTAAAAAAPRKTIAPVAAPVPHTPAAKVYEDRSHGARPTRKTVQAQPTPPTSNPTSTNQNSSRPASRKRSAPDPQPESETTAAPLVVDHKAKKQIRTISSYWHEEHTIPHITACMTSIFAQLNQPQPPAAKKRKTTTSSKDENTNAETFDPLTTPAPTTLTPQQIPNLAVAAFVVVYDTIFDASGLDGPLFSGENMLAEKSLHALDGYKPGQKPLTPVDPAAMKEVRWFISCIRRGWGDMGWMDHMPDDRQGEGVTDAMRDQATEQARKEDDEEFLREEEEEAMRKMGKTPVPRRKAQGEGLGAAGLLPGLGTMFQPGVDWLSTERVRAFEHWRREVSRLTGVVGVTPHFVVEWKGLAYQQQRTVQEEEYTNTMVRFLDVLVLVSFSNFFDIVHPSHIIHIHLVFIPKITANTSSTDPDHLEDKTTPSCLTISPPQDTSASRNGQTSVNRPTMLFTFLFQPGPGPSSPCRPRVRSPTPPPRREAERSAGNLPRRLSPMRPTARDPMERRNAIAGLSIPARDIEVDRRRPRTPPPAYTADRPGTEGRSRSPPPYRRNSVAASESGGGAGRRVRFDDVPTIIPSPPGSTPSSPQLPPLPYTPETQTHTLSTERHTSASTPDPASIASIRAATVELGPDENDCVFNWSIANQAFILVTRAESEARSAAAVAEARRNNQARVQALEDVAAYAVDWPRRPLPARGDRPACSSLRAGARDTRSASTPRRNHSNLDALGRGHPHRPARRRRCWCCSERAGAFLLVAVGVVVVVVVIAVLAKFERPGVAQWKKTRL